MERLLALVLSPRDARDGEEVLGAALAAAQGSSVEATIIGPEGDAADSLARSLWRAGAERVWLATDPSLEDADGDRWVTAAVEVVEQVEPTVVLLRADGVGAEVGPRLAWRLGAAVVTEVVGMRRDPSGGLLWIRPTYGGKALAAVRSQRSRCVVTVRPRAFRAPQIREGEPSPGAVERLALRRAPATAQRVRVVEVRTHAQEGPRLEEARVVVAGGRGIGGPEGFQVLQDLARLLGGAVGASRGAVDEGWAPGYLQIGQTGKKIAPQLYVAVGISGASQHVAGVSGARHIVAINNDPRAPIFRVAELGVVEDWRQIVPRLVARLSELRSSDTENR